MTTGTVKLCECGCGKPTLPGARTDTARGKVKGQPSRFLPHHNARQALHDANVVRSRRAVLRRDLRAGELPAARVLAELPDELASMTTIEFLLCLPSYGKARANGILKVTGIPQFTRLGVLTDRQRWVLIAALRDSDRGLMERRAKRLARQAQRAARAVAA